MTNKRDIVIYHPGTGTLIPLSDEVYMFDYASLDVEAQEDLAMGAMTYAEAYATGIRLDNFNMGNIFFGDRA